MNSEKNSVGLVLTGGGARGAYQAGALKALGEILTQAGFIQEIKTITGISAGAINAVYLACHINNWKSGTEQLCDIWSRLNTNDVFRSDFTSLGRIGFRWFSDLTFGAFKRNKQAYALLDTTPLRELLDKTIPYSQIQQNIENGWLNSVACSAFDYTRSLCVTFVQGKTDIKPWQRPRRKSEMVSIDTRHVMASSALPILFPPVQIDDRYFSDGTFRNAAPISPAIHLESNKIIIIGVKRVPLGQFGPVHMGRPSIGRIFGHILNSLFFDLTDLDVERIQHVNDILNSRPTDQMEHFGQHLNKIDFLWLRPSKDLGKIAKEASKDFPRTLKYLLKGLGSPKENSEIASYLLFEKSYTTQLIELGYQDTLSQRDSIIQFLSPQNNNDFIHLFN